MKTSGARRGFLSGTRVGEAEDLPVREEEEEVEEDRAEEEERERAGHLDEVVDPVVARRPEPADEEEHEEDAEEEEDLRRGVPRAPGVDEEPEPEEQPAEQGVVDVGRRAEAVGREDQLRARGPALRA